MITYVPGDDLYGVDEGALVVQHLPPLHVEPVVEFKDRVPSRVQVLIVPQSAVMEKALRKLGVSGTYDKEQGRDAGHVNVASAAIDPVACDAVVVVVPQDRGIAARPPSAPLSEKQRQDIARDPRSRCRRKKLTKKSPPIAGC